MLLVLFTFLNMATRKFMIINVPCMIFLLNNAGLETKQGPRQTIKTLLPREEQIVFLGQGTLAWNHLL